MCIRRFCTKSGKICISWLMWYILIPNFLAKHPKITGHVLLTVQSASTLFEYECRNLISFYTWIYNKILHYYLTKIATKSCTSI